MSESIETNSLIWSIVHTKDVGWNISDELLLTLLTWPNRALLPGPMQLLALAAPAIGLDVLEFVQLNAAFLFFFDRVCAI